MKNPSVRALARLLCILFFFCALPLSGSAKGTPDFVEIAAEPMAASAQPPSEEPEADSARKTRIAEISFAEEELRLPLGADSELFAEFAVRYEGAAQDTEEFAVAVETDDVSVASVDMKTLRAPKTVQQNGLFVSTYAIEVLPKGAGEAKLTVQVTYLGEKYRASIPLVVLAAEDAAEEEGVATAAPEAGAPEPSFALAPSYTEVYPGEDFLFAIEGTAVPEGNIIWASNDEAVARVDAEGHLVPVAPGTATITATYADGEKPYTRSATVVVMQGATALAFDRAELAKCAGEREDLSAHLVWNDGATEPANKAVRWIVEDNTVASVDEGGMLKARKIGETDVYAYAYNGVFARLHVSVLRGVEKLALDAYDISLYPGEQATISAFVFPELATDAFAWELKPGEDKFTALHRATEIGSRQIAIEGVTPGKTSFEATLTDGSSGAEVRKTVYVTVKVMPTLVEVDSLAPKSSGETYPKLVTAEKGDIRLFAALSGENAMPADDQRVLWESLSEDVATVDESGVVAIHKAGSATIRATSVANPLVSGTISVVVPENDAPNGVHSNGNAEKAPILVGKATAYGAVAREAASAGAPSLYRLKRGSTVYVVGEADGWYAIRREPTGESGGTAYIPKHCIAVAGEMEQGEKDDGQAIVAAEAPVYASVGDVPNVPTGRVYRGARVAVLGQAEGGYAKVRLASGMECLIDPVHLDAGGTQSVDTYTEHAAAARIKETVALRAAPSKGSKKLGKLETGATVSVIGARKNGYYRISTKDGVKAYVYAGYLQLYRAEGAEKTVGKGSGAYGAPTCRNLNVRSEPSTESGAILATLHDGAYYDEYYGVTQKRAADTVQVISSIDGESGAPEWYCVHLESGAYGWVKAEFLKVVQK